MSYLLPLLDTVEKLSLLTEVRLVGYHCVDTNGSCDHIYRSVLEAPDLAKFDELVSPKEAEMLMEKTDGK